MKQRIQDEPDVGSGAADSTALTAGLLRRQTAEAIAHLREQASRMHAGLPPDPFAPDAAGEKEVSG